MSEWMFLIIVILYIVITVITIGILRVAWKDDDPEGVEVIFGMFWPLLLISLLIFYIGKPLVAVGEYIGKLIFEREKKPKRTEQKSKEKTGDRLGSQYARLFDEACTGWERDSQWNLVFLKDQQRYANDLLRAKGHLFLNDVYEMLDMPKSKAGQVVGWIYDPENPMADNYVDFGLGSDKNREAIDFGYTTFLLDFNVDGIIIDRI